MEVAPAVAAAIHRMAGSGEASGEAQSAAAIALKLTACPPNGAATSVKRPVVATSGPGFGRYPYAPSTASPGRFCDAMVTMNKGAARPMTASSENSGATNIGRGMIVARLKPPARPLAAITSPATSAAIGVA